MLTESFWIKKQGEAVVISGAGGGLGHLGVQIASRCMGYRVIVSFNMESPP